MDYEEILLRKFPSDPRLELYAKPNLPPAKLGKVLAAFKRINPTEVVALHLYGGVFSSGAIALTKTACYYSDGMFLLEDVRGASSEKDVVTAQVNQAGGLTTHKIKTGDEQAASLIANVLDNLTAAPKADMLLEQVRAYDNFSREAINWLELRDEIIRTIELLDQLFQDGKINLLELESKRQELLDRL